MLKAGDSAPDFEALLDDGSTFRLTDYRGSKNVVLYFYPADFTAGCTAQACSFRDSYAAITAYDAIIVGVSHDSAESHRSFKEKHHLSYPIITDPDGRLEQLYDVKSSLPLIRPRVTYVIDKAGVIRTAFRHDIAIGRHLHDTLAALEAIRAGSNAA
jgi:peroxiredoxin Q/BCP